MTAETKSVRIWVEMERRAPALGPIPDPTHPTRFDVFSEALGTTTPMTFEADTAADAALRWVRHMGSRGGLTLSRLADGKVVTVVAGPSIFEVLVSCRDEPVLTASECEFDVPVVASEDDGVKRSDGEPEP
jgi:hypothetical protein